MKSLITVNIEVNQIWPTARDLERRNVVIDKLAARETGMFVEAGTAVGNMVIKYEVDRQSSIAVSAVIYDALAYEFPDKKFTIEVSQPERNQNVANDRRQPQAKIAQQGQLDFGRGM